MKAVFISDNALAWRLMVRRVDPETKWNLYSTYDSLKAANATVKAIKGYPLETKLIPLYQVLINV